MFKPQSVFILESMPFKVDIALLDKPSKSPSLIITLPCFPNYYFLNKLKEVDT